MQEDGQKGGLWSVQNTVGHKEKVYFYSSFSQAGHIFPHALETSSLFCGLSIVSILSSPHFRQAISWFLLRLLLCYEVYIVRIYKVLLTLNN